MRIKMSPKHSPVVWDGYVKYELAEADRSDYSSYFEM